MLNELEPRMVHQRADVRIVPGEEIVDTDDVMSFLDESVAQIGTDEARASGHDNVAGRGTGIHRYAPAAAALTSPCAGQLVNSRNGPGAASSTYKQELLASVPQMRIFGAAVDTIAGRTMLDPEQSQRSDIRVRSCRRIDSGATGIEAGGDAHGAPPADFFNVQLKLPCPLLRGVAAKHPFARRCRDLEAALFRDVLQNSHHILWAVRDENFLAQLKNRVEAGPAIADDRHAAGRRFEQAHARGEACVHHIGAGDVERVALSAVEGGMHTGRYMFDALDVGGTSNVGGRTPPGHGETAVREPARRLDQQSRELLLPVAAIRPEIAEAPSQRCRLGAVQVRIDAATERARPGAAVQPFDQLERRPAGE